MFLERLDQNGDGVLQAAEIPERMQSMVDRYAGRPGAAQRGNIRIAELVANAERARGSGNRGGQPGSAGPTADSRMANADSGQTKPTVSGFGETVEVTTVPGFDPSAAVSTANSSTPSGSAAPAPAGRGNDTSSALVDRVLRTYDKNGNGSLDQAEWAAVKWNGAGPETSDTNRDGRLSRQELAARLARRNTNNSSSSSRESGEQVAARGGRGSQERPNWGGWGRNSDGASARGRGWGGGEEGLRRNRDGEGGRGPFGRGGSDDDQPRGRREGNQDESGGDRYQRYAEAMMRRYDRNENGVLERDEWSQMRGDPSELDPDGDGRVTTEELAARMGGNRAGGTRQARSSASDDSASGRSYRFLTAQERWPSDIPGWYAERDRDADGQLSMAEWASRWTADEVAEFARYDANSDGFVTPAEAIAGDR
jgi:hypothetical protein